MLAVDIWADTVTLRDGEGERRIIGLAELKREVAMSQSGPTETGRESGEES